MVLTGLYNVGEIPFHHVYIHPKIMDGFGEGMSKTKGNGADPLDIIDLYGTDAMRYGMAALATETQDSRMPISNVCPHCGTLIPQNPRIARTFLYEFKAPTGLVSWDSGLVSPLDTTRPAYDLVKSYTSTGKIAKR